MILVLWIFIQIIGEGLPISSSSHVVLMQKLFKFFNIHYTALPYLSAIDFVLHGPTILIVSYYFYTTWRSFFFSPIGAHRSFDFQKFLKTMFFVCVVDFITVCFWFADIAHLQFVQIYFLPIGLFLTASCLWYSKFKVFEKKKLWSVSDAIILGLVQGLSLMPGISRFASTYAVGLWLGYGRFTSFALSFLIEIPLMCVGFLKGLLVLYQVPDVCALFASASVICSLVLASLVSYVLFCFVAMLLKENKLWYFAFYMIIPMMLSIVL